MVVAVIQARMGSTRLPGKVAKLVLGKPMLSHQIGRIKHSKLVDKIVIATTDKAEDDKVEEIAKECGVACFRGSEKDVLDRFYKTAKMAGAETIVRLTGDCPFSDPLVIDEIIQFFFESGIDDTGTPENYPEGLDAEVFSFAALERAWKEAEKPSEREHVTPYLYNHPEIFKVKRLKTGKLYQGSEDISKYHWSVDERQDFEFAVRIFERLYQENKLFLMNDILEVIRKEPELLEINKGFTGYEGYQKSIKEDEEHAKKQK